MSKSKLGPLPDAVFENDLPVLNDVDARYSAEYLQRREALGDRVAAFSKSIASRDVVLRRHVRLTENDNET